MKISYLPETESPTGSTVFPVVLAGTTYKTQLSALNNFSGSGNVSQVFAGDNIKLTPSVATKTASLSFYFPGAIFPYASNDLPTGWLWCNGQEVGRGAYPDLFAAIGLTYGIGDNRTTFNLPDLRGRAIAGLETMGGVSSSGRLTNTRPGNVNATNFGTAGGSQSHLVSLEEGAVPAHNHVVISSFSLVGEREDGDGRASEGNGIFDLLNPPEYSSTIGYSFSLNPNSSTATEPHTNIPPLVFLNWVIKY